MYHRPNGVVVFLIPRSHLLGAFFSAIVKLEITVGHKNRAKIHATTILFVKFHALVVKVSSFWLFGFFHFRDDVSTVQVSKVFVHWGMCGMNICLKSKELEIDC